jgi:Holliday junction resolvase
LKGYRINRHNGICGILSDRLKEKGWTVALEPRIKTAGGKTLIPDIIAVKDRQAVVIDPTIIYENSDHSQLGLT